MAAADFWQIKKLDVAVIVLVAALSLLPLLFIPRGRADTVTVSQHGALLYEGALNADAVVEAAGCTVVIENGRAFVRDADCPDGLCVAAGAAQHGRPVVCLPNELVITVSASKEDAVDALTY